MGTPVREQAPPTPPAGQAPDWSPVSEPGPGARHPLVAPLARSAVGLGVAAVLWLLGHTAMAAVLAGLLTVLTAATLLSPRFAAVVERAVHALQRAVGRALTVVLLGAVQLLVFTPVWLLAKLFRRDPLAFGASPEDASFWQPIPRYKRPLHTRPFAYERMPRPAVHGDRLPLPRLRALLGLLLLVVLLDVGIGAAVKALTDEETPDALGGLVGQDVPAAAGEPWRVGLGSEIDGLWKLKEYDPYLGWTMPDFEGRHVNVSGGVRRSYEAPGTAGAPTVAFFGGSAMFGLYQRDLRTIPSEFARLAEADGIPVRVRNHAALAYTGWQEMLLLEQLTTDGDAPDLAVFYDGFNELLGQFQLGPHSDPTHLEAAEIDWRLGLGQRGVEFEPERSLPDAVHRAWADVSATHRLGRQLGGLDEPSDEGPVRPSGIWAGDQADQPERRGELAASIYARGQDITTRLADSYGFRAAFFWQPFLYGKRIHPGEQELVGWLGTDGDAWAAADRAARSRLAESTVDLSRALDRVDEPVMYDFVHTNELGAKVIARAMYNRLRPQLRELAGR
jgi:hypothetical protein